MRPACFGSVPRALGLLLACFAIAGCDLNRDLSAGKFACGTGFCPDAGAVIDAATLLDAGPPPECEPTFGPATACGGDVDGTWRAVSACSSTFGLNALL